MADSKASNKAPVKMFIGMPVSGGQMMMGTVISLLRTVMECRELGWDSPTFEFRVGDSDLCRARNAIIGKFLTTDCTHMMLIDSDISWNQGHIPQLIGHGKDFVAAAYKGKTDDKELYFIQWPEQKRLDINPHTGLPLLNVDGISIGFCRLTRPCVEKLVASLNGRYFFDQMYPDEKIPWLIDFDHHNGVRMEEGYSLCKRWRNLGGEIWVDPTINLGHMGYKVFDSDLIGFLDMVRSSILNKTLADARDLNAILEEKLYPTFTTGERALA